MKQKLIYLRKKGDSYIFESKVKGKTTFIYTIPKDYHKFLIKLIESGFFTKEKAEKIKTILQSSDYKSEKKSKVSPEVRTTDIIGISENDENDIEDLDNELNELVDRT